MDPAPSVEPSREGHAVVAEIGADVEDDVVGPDAPLELMDVPGVFRPQPEKAAVAVIGRIERPPQAMPDDLDVPVDGHAQPLPEPRMEPPLAGMVGQLGAVEQQGLLEQRHLGHEKAPGDYAYRIRGKARRRSTTLAYWRLLRAAAPSTTKVQPRTSEKLN